jgi:hypothetical protein
VKSLLHIIVFFYAFSSFASNHPIVESLENPFEGILPKHVHSLKIGSLLNNEQAAIFLNLPVGEDAKLFAVINATLTRPLTRQLPALMLPPYALVFENREGEVLAGFLLYVSAIKDSYVACPVDVRKDGQFFKLVPLKTYLMRENEDKWGSLPLEAKLAILETRYVKLADFGDFFRQLLLNPKTGEWIQGSL